jgi:Spy/CpxP family protein refolding chaperone
MAGALGTMIAASGVSPVGVLAQEGATLQEDPLFATLYPPELIMQHRRAIELTDEQRDAISRLISELQGEVLSLQWELQDELEELGAVTGRSRVELDRAIDEMGDVLDKEKDIKLAHLEMLVRIKNVLTAEQQALLDELRAGG